MYLMVLTFSKLIPYLYKIHGSAPFATYIQGIFPYTLAMLDIQICLLHPYGSLADPSGSIWYFDCY